MVDELISRQALLKDIEETVVFSVRPDKPSAEIRGANKILDRINSAPSVDAVMLPCEVGDTLFFVLDGKIYRAKVRYLRWEHHKDRGIRTDITANITPYSSVCASFDDFGKTVFLTREEAEKALEGREDNATD